MKKVLLSCIYILFTGFITYAQPATSISMNFNTDCITSGGYPGDWQIFNLVSGTVGPGPLGAWHCAPLNGRGATSTTYTPGMECTGFYSSSYHLDTSFLITPILNIASYPGSLYLRFDSKVSKIHMSEKMALMINRDTNANFATMRTYNDLSTTIAPPFGIPDSSGWVTHFVNITRYKDSGDFRLGFRYTSSATAASKWYLDNIYTSEVNEVPEVGSSLLPLTVIGNYIPGQITISCSLPSAGSYELAVYDILGRNIRQETIIAKEGLLQHTIDGLYLQTGMYVIKLSGEHTYGYAKTTVY